MATNTISSTSTLDIQSVVSALTKSQEIRITQNQKEQTSYEVKISDLAKIKSKNSDFYEAIKKVDNNVTNNLSQEDLQKALKGFVDTYNSANTQNKSSNQYNVKSLTSKVRQDMNPQDYLSLGISFDKSGVATFDADKFNTNYNTDSNNIKTLASNTFNNVLAKASNFTSILDDNSGTIKTQQNTYQNKIKLLERQEDNLVRQKDLMTQNYIKQYSSLQNILTTMNNQQQSVSNITSILGSTK